MAADLSQRVSTYRQNLRNAGLRPIQIWVPDTRRAGFAEECARQSQAVHGRLGEADMFDFIENASDLDERR